MNRETAIKNKTLSTVMFDLGCWLRNSPTGLFKTVQGTPVRVGVKGQADLDGFERKIVADCYKIAAQKSGSASEKWGRCTREECSRFKCAFSPRCNL